MTETAERIEDFAVLREVEEAWLAEHLSDAIASLGYPVGCGIAPHPETMAKAARNLFDRYARMVELARSAADAELLALRKRVGELEGALTPGAETKAAYIGEFTIAVARIVNDDEEPVDDGADAPDPYDHIQVPWTTIKQIMAAIRARASLSNTKRRRRVRRGIPARGE